MARRRERLCGRRAGSPRNPSTARKSSTYTFQAIFTAPLGGLQATASRRPGRNTLRASRPPPDCDTLGAVASGLQQPPYRALTGCNTPRDPLAAANLFALAASVGVLRNQQSWPQMARKIADKPHPLCIRSVCHGVNGETSALFN